MYVCFLTFRMKISTQIDKFTRIISKVYRSCLELLYIWRHKIRVPSYLHLRAFKQSYDNIHRSLQV
jgi:hypothetical protein